MESKQMKRGCPKRPGKKKMADIPSVFFQKRKEALQKVN